MTSHKYYFQKKWGKNLRALVILPLTSLHVKFAYCISNAGCSLSLHKLFYFRSIDFTWVEFYKLFLVSPHHLSQCLLVCLSISLPGYRGTRYVIEVIMKNLKHNAYSYHGSRLLFIPKNPVYLKLVEGNRQMDRQTELNSHL